MYERFSERARKVMAIANTEAQRSKHEYIGPEHILLGLVKEGSGTGAEVLKNFDIDFRKVRLEVDKLVKSGPDKVTMGMLPLTPSANRVIEYAILEARTFGQNYVGTEHLLLGLIRENIGVAAQVLLSLDLKLEDVREEVFKVIGQSNIEELKRSESPLSAPTDPDIWEDYVRLPVLGTVIHKGWYHITVVCPSGKTDLIRLPQSVLDTMPQNGQVLIAHEGSDFFFGVSSHRLTTRRSDRANDSTPRQPKVGGVFFLTNTIIISSTPQRQLTSKRMRCTGWSD